MEDFAQNEYGVPQYPKGHNGRLFVVAAAVATLPRPTATTIAKLTSLTKGNIDRMVDELQSQFGMVIEKEGPVYQLINWGRLLDPEGVKSCLKYPVREKQKIFKLPKNKY